MLGAIRSPEMSPEEARQLREHFRQIAEQCKKDLGVKSIKVAIGEEEWCMPTDKCPNGHDKSPDDNGKACYKCRTIGIFEVDDLSVENTAYHEILHILLPERPEWLIKLCSRILMNEEIEWETPLSNELVDARMIKEWCEFVNIDPLPSREALISICKEITKRKEALGED